MQLQKRTPYEEIERVRGAIPFKYEVIASIVVVELLALKDSTPGISDLLTQHRI
jgi:hypothetical protein